VIKVWRLITEDRAGEHAPAVPWSRTSSWSWNLTRAPSRSLGRSARCPAWASTLVRDDKRILADACRVLVHSFKQIPQHNRM